MLSTRLDEPVVVDASRRRHDDVVRPVAAAMEGASERRETFEITSAEPRTGRPERVPAEDRLRDEVEDQLLRRVLDHGDLLEHDLPLRVEVGEGRREDHVGHDVERGLQVLVEDARVDDGVVARGGRVQLAAERVEDLGDRRAPSRKPCP